MLTQILLASGSIVTLGTAIAVGISTTVDIANTNINLNANPTPNAVWQVRAQTFTEDSCGGAYIFLWLDPDICIDFAADVKSLRIVGYDGPVRYNSLKVYSDIGCHSAANPQPVLGRSCVQTVGDKSIKLKTYS